MIKIRFLLILLFIASFANAQTISNNNTRLIEDWQYIKQDLGGIWEAVRIARIGSPEALPVWSDVELPHCFNAEDAVDPDINYYQGPGWYKTAIEINNPYKQGRTLLHFEGAGQKTDVFVGFDKVASHVGGYDEWIVDVSDYVDSIRNDSLILGLYDNKIPLSIRCDNSRDLEMIPSDLSDFNVYGGLYRYVNLIYVPQSYISQVHIETSFQGKSKGQVYLDIALLNEAQNEMILQVEVKNLQGEMVYESELLTSDNKLKCNFILNKIAKWSPDNPALYHLEIKTQGVNGGQIYSDNFGFREFLFEKNGPFYLNGERLLLRGTHRHEDHAGVAAAMTEEMIRKEMQLMKDMGVNFIRLGHYQQSRIVLNLCDSLGILVWEEIPWCRGGVGGEVYKTQAKRMLTNMINQHYNHPSVIVWGLGNENDWPGDFTEFDKMKIRSFMKELHELAHKFDPERQTAIRRCDFCKDIVDVYSPSIWAGWYRGKFTEYKDVSYSEMKEVDHFLHVEWGGSSHAGRHDENPDKGLENIKIGQGADERAGDASLVGGQARVSKDGNWSETYMCNLFDWHLKEQEMMPWLTGTAQWAFKDFSTPIRPHNPVPYMNQKGVVERDLTPKESYYVFQSYWTDKPMVHIYGHSWPIRWGADGEQKIIKVYSNCSSVELFLNGKSLGKKKRNVQDYPAAGLHWDVALLNGKNQLKAIANSDGKEIIDSIEVHYQTEKWDTPRRMEVEEVLIDETFSWIEVKVYDNHSILCLDAVDMITFTVSGDAQLIDNLGTVSGSRYVGLCNGTARIKIKKSGLNYRVAVMSPGLQTAIME